MKHSTGRPTKAQVSRFEQLRAIGCLCCKKLGLPFQCGATEIHHTLSGGKRRGHDYTLPLGSYHHRGTLWAGMTTKQMMEFFGPSLARGSKPFREKFGTDDELLAEVNKLIGATV